MLMKQLPNLSYLSAVGRLRYIQSVHEPADRRNPDTLVRHFFSMRERWRIRWLSRGELAKLRSDPFYYYLVARTKHYDEVFTGALSTGVRQIINVGCGSDTRAYRFSRMAAMQGVGVWECDQAEAIHAKQWLAKRLGSARHVEYLSIDLNDAAWPDFERRLSDLTGTATLVLMEGVSPYIDESAFGRFLAVLAGKLMTGSCIAYDFKLRGVDDAFGRAGRTRVPFRLPETRSEIALFHDPLGLRLEHFELSADLSRRLIPGVEASFGRAYGQDGLVQLRVGSR
jgi:methyltransferase (TIGR00027 family)